MAKVITTELQHSGASAANITLDSSKNVTCENNLQVDGNVTVTGTLPADKLTGNLPAISGASLTGITSSDTLSNRNVIINGEMKINQRGTVSSITSSKYAGPDRWKANLNAGTWTVSQESDGPPGFGYSYKIVCSTAKASLGTGDIVQILHQLEGQDVQRFKKGTSSAQTFSLSFWCKSNYTNTYIAELYDNDNDRCVSKSFTVSSSDTWEKKTFSFPADTTGAFGNDNGASMRIYIKLAAGTDFTSGTLNTSAWIAQDNTKRAGGIGNLAGAVDRFFCVTGVQLEAGDTVTEYEHRSYHDELLRCQRYFWMYYYPTAAAKSLMVAHNWHTNQIFGHINFPCRMRSAPSGVVTNGTNYWTAYKTTPNTSNFDTMSQWNASENSAILEGMSPSVTAGESCFCTGNNAAASFAFNAEL